MEPEIGLEPTTHALRKREDPFKIAVFNFCRRFVANFYCKKIQTRAICAI